MKELAKLQDMEEEFEVKNIKSLIKVCLDFNATKEIIIERLVEYCNLTKEQAEEYLELYNEGEL